MRLTEVTAAQEDEPDDVEAVRNALSNRVAFATVYWRYRDRVYRYLRTRTPQETDAADLTQQVFLRALGQLDQYMEERGTVAAWIFGIARHSVSDFQRKQHRTKAMEHDSIAIRDVIAPDEVEEEVLRRDDILRLHHALSVLPIEKREILALRFAGGLTIPEIAVVINKSAEATRKQLRRTIEFLEEFYRDKDT
jgi:RNA polymerase sigma-70 factor, ECF subfamily